MVQGQEGHSVNHWLSQGAKLPCAASPALWLPLPLFAGLGEGTLPGETVPAIPAACFSSFPQWAQGREQRPPVEVQEGKAGVKRVAGGLAAPCL